MPFGKDKNISQGRPDGRKKNKGSIDNIKKSQYTKGDERLVGDNNPRKPKIDRRKFNVPPVLLNKDIGKETRFKKGHTPRNKLLRTILKEKGFSREVINDIFADILTANPKLIKEMKVNDEISMLELIGISGVEAAMRTADFGRMDYLLGQIFGRPVQRTETVNYNMNTSLDPKTSDEDAEIMRRVFEKTNGESSN